MGITSDDIIAYLDGVGTATLQTIGGNAAFTARREGNHFVITTAAGTTRNVSMSNVWRVLAVYNVDGSTTTTDYAGVTQNASYLLALIEATARHADRGPEPAVGGAAAPPPPGTSDDPMAPPRTAPTTNVAAESSPSRVWVFWTAYGGDVPGLTWLARELLEGRLRQGWGREEMSLVDGRNEPLDYDVWHGRYVAAARGAAWKEEELAGDRVRTRHRILLNMLDIRAGDLLVIPRKPGHDEMALALAAGPYQFEVDADIGDFGHLIPVDVASLKVVARDATDIGSLLKDLSSYRSAIRPVRDEQVAQRIMDVYARLSVETLTAADGESPYDDADHTTPIRLATTIRRIVRDTAKGRALKARYGHACQVCGIGIRLPQFPNAYVEVHHLVPLGGDHVGNDDWNNMIVVCPNCHVAFDGGAYRIQPQTLRLHTTDGEREIRFIASHRLDPENLERHWRLQES